MIFLDTSYLVALAMPTDNLHARALAWSNHLPGPFLTTEYVLCEFLNSLSMPSNRTNAHVLLAGVHENASIQVISSSTHLFEAGVAMHAERSDKAWALTDCISFVVMQETHVTQALTYDHHFEQAGFNALLRDMPST